MSETELQQQNNTVRTAAGKLLRGGLTLTGVRLRGNNVLAYSYSTALEIFLIKQSGGRSNF